MRLFNFTSMQIPLIKGAVMKQTLILPACAMIATAYSAQAMTILFSDDLGAGDNASTSVPGWGGGAYNNADSTNKSTQTQSNPIVSGRGGVAQLNAMFPGPPNGTGPYSGTQLSTNLSTSPNSLFTGYSLSDITLSFDISVLSDKSFGSNPPGFINIEIRESGNAGATKRFRPIPVDVTGSFGSYSYTLDQSLSNPSVNFGTGTLQLYFQVQNNYSDAAGATTTNMQFDNVQITAVPEPSTALLGGLAAIFLLRRRR